MTVWHKYEERAWITFYLTASAAYDSPLGPPNNNRMCLNLSTDAFRGIFLVKKKYIRTISAIFTNFITSVGIFTRLISDTLKSS